MILPSLATRIVGGPVGFARLLKRRGPAFVRLGQMLALCPDLVPPGFRAEFTQESPGSSPLSAQQVRAFLASELGSVDALFREISPVPVSRPGFAQVHQAVTADGRNVLIKLLPPVMRERARRDIRSARILARVAFSRRELAGDPGIQLERELDLVAERENIRKLALLCEDDSFLRVPRVYAELCTAGVLTMENLGGIPMTAVLSAARRASLRLEGYAFDARVLADRLLRGAMRQVLERNFYCADLHPQNILLLPGNTVTFVGFGYCAALEPASGLSYTRFLLGVFSRELPRMSRAFETLLVATDSTQVEKLHDDFIHESHQWLRGAPPSRRTRAEEYSSPLSHWLAAILQVARQNRFQIPAAMLSAFRTLIALETVAIRLDPEVHLQSAGQEVLNDIVLEDAFRRLEPMKQRSALLNLLNVLRDAPEQLDQILTELAQGRLNLSLNATEHPHSAATRNRRSRLMAAAIAAVGVAWLLGEPGVRSAGFFPASLVLAAILGFLYLCMIVLWRRLG